jgi:serine/threonine protein kinase
MFPGDDEIDQIYIIKKGIADLTPLQLDHFKKNEKFRNIELPGVKRTESIEGRYLGKIEKNALSFMRCCLKMDPNERITVEEALKHPYLLPFSLEDNEFSND